MPKPPAYPRSDEIRAAVINRTKEFSRITGMSLAKIGEQALNDSKFLYTVTADPRTVNFHLSTYTKLMRWLDRKWPEGDIVPPPCDEKRGGRRASP